MENDVSLEVKSSQSFSLSSRLIARQSYKLHVRPEVEAVQVDTTRRPGVAAERDFFNHS